jgi:hypothetical protein
MFSKTERTGMRLKDWKMKPRVSWRRAVSSLSFRSFVGLSPMRTVPAVGRSTQPIMLRIVVLPEPEGPAMEMKSPFSMQKETPLTASTSTLPRG